MTVDFKVNVSIAVCVVVWVVIGVLAHRLHLSRVQIIGLGLVAGFLWSLLLTLWALDGPLWGAILLFVMIAVTMPAFLQIAWKAVDKIKRK